MAEKEDKRIKALGGRNVFLLGLVSLLNDFSSEMILPILPLLILELGGTGLTLGLIGGLMEGLPHLLKIPTGFFSDKMKKRKPFIFLGYLNSQIFKFLLIFASGWKTVLAFTSLDKLGKGIREAPRDALISESMPGEKGRAFGIQRAFDTTGAILGSITVLLIVLFMGLQFKKIIIIAALIGFISLLPLSFLREVDARDLKYKKIKQIKFKKAVSRIPLNLRIFFVVSGIFALANFSYMFFVIKTYGASFNGGTNAFVIPILLYVLFNIFYASFAIPFGKLSDEIGRRKVLITGYFLFSLVCFGFLIFSSIYMFIALFILYGLVYAMIVGNQRALVADYSPEELKATCLGIFQAVLGICAIISGLIAGILFDINKNLTFAYGAGIGLLSALVFLFLFDKMKRNPDQVIKKRY